MYSQAEASLVKQKFWTSLGMYLAPIPSSNGEKVNWINYKTGIKGIAFKMDADKNRSSVMIEILLGNTMLQHQYFDIFNNFASDFKKTLCEDWIFHKNYFIENKGNVSLIIVQKENTNVFKQEDWPTIISFLKQQILGLDEFWIAYKPAFELI